MSLPAVSDADLRKQIQGYIDSDGYVRCLMLIVTAWSSVMSVLGPELPQQVCAPLFARTCFGEH